MRTDRASGIFTKEPTESSWIVDLILLCNFLELFFSTPSLEFLNVGSVIWERLQLDELLKVEILFFLHSLDLFWIAL